MDINQFILEYGKVFVTLVGVVLTAWFALKKYQKELNDKREVIVNAVFGDLANVIEHYTYAKNEIILLLSSENEKVIRLKFSQFGALKSVEKVQELGNLTPKQIRLLLQINLRIRNTDLLLESLLNISLTKKEVEQLNQRMNYCINTASEIIGDIVSTRKKLRNEWKEIQRI
jgi:uncharacterized protein YneF (UPF0154 family)